MANRLVAAMHRQYWLGFDSALDTIGAALHRLALEQELTPDQERLRLAVSGMVHELAPDENLLIEMPTNADLAVRYSISVRTVTTDGHPARIPNISPLRGLKICWSRGLQRCHTAGAGLGAFSLRSGRTTARMEDGGWRGLKMGDVRCRAGMGRGCD
jgi:hypothetical protein